MSDPLEPTTPRRPGRIKRHRFGAAPRKSLGRPTAPELPAAEPDEAVDLNGAATYAGPSNGIGRAMIDVVDAIVRAETIDRITEATLETVRREFHWSYGSYWTLDLEQKASLVFSGGNRARWTPNSPSSPDPPGSSKGKV